VRYWKKIRDFTRASAPARAVSLGVDPDQPGRCDKEKPPRSGRKIRYGDMTFRPFVPWLHGRNWSRNHHYPQWRTFFFMR